MNVLKSFIGTLLIFGFINLVFKSDFALQGVDDAEKFGYAFGITLMLIIGIYLLQSGLRKEYKGEKKTEMKIGAFLKEFFKNTKEFFKQHINKKRTPFLLLMIWLMGSVQVFNIIDGATFLKGGGVASWGLAWFMVVIFSIFYGYIFYVVIGALYYLGARLAGGKKDWLISRNIVLYAGLPLYLTVFAAKIIETFAYGSDYFVAPIHNSVDIAFVFLTFTAAIYSVILAYKAGRNMLQAKRALGIVLLVIIPILYFAYVLGVNLNAYTAKEEVATQYNDQAIEQLNSGDLHQAESSLKLAIRNLDQETQKDDLITAYINLASVYQYMEDFNSAVSSYQDAISLLDESDARYFALSGMVSFTNGNLDESITNFEKTLKLDSDEFTANNILSLIYLGRFDSEKTDFEKALSYNEKAYALNNTDAATIQNLAVNYYELGNFEDAIPLLEDSIELLPNNVYSKYLLGMTYYQIGDLDNAKKYLNEAVSMNPDVLTEEIQEILNTD